MISIHLTQALGHAGDPGIAERLHNLSHRGCVDYLHVDTTDINRRRQRLTSEQGVDCMITLPRDQLLSNGAVLELADDRAVVIRISEQQWLKLRPRDCAAALELGYLAGNLHWREKFQDEILAVALQGPEVAYLERLHFFLNDGRAERAPV